MDADAIRARAELLAATFEQEDHAVLAFRHALSVVMLESWEKQQRMLDRLKDQIIELLEAEKARLANELLELQPVPRATTERAKDNVFDHWFKWINNQESYASQKAFALCMLELNPSLGSQQVIERWCRSWKARLPADWDARRRSWTLTTEALQLIEKLTSREE